MRETIDRWGDIRIPPRRKWFLMNCGYFFFLLERPGNNKGRRFSIPRYSTTNPEFANSKRLPKVSSLVRDKWEQQKGHVRNDCGERKDVFIAPATNLPYFFYSWFYLNTTYIYLLLKKNIARNVRYLLHAAGIVFQLSFFLFMWNVSISNTARAYRE